MHSWPLASIADFALNKVWVIESTSVTFYANYIYRLYIVKNTYWVVIIFALKSYQNQEYYIYLSPE
jgi:hypothetical protein